MRKNCSSDWEKLLKFEAEGREFVKFFSITRTIFLTVGQNNFGNKIPLFEKKSEGKSFFRKKGFILQKQELQTQKVAEGCHIS